MFRSVLAAAAAALLAAVPAAHAGPLELGPVAPGGHPVTAAGDVNGDGRPDLAIGSAPGAPLALTIVFGGPGLASPAVPAPGEEALRVSFPGTTNVDAIYPSPVGDVDGDGYDDVSIAFNPDPGTPNQGRGGRLVLRGAPGGGTFTLADLAARRLGLGPGGGGPSLALRLGDIDGDGYDDVLTEYRYSGGTPCSDPAVSVVSGPCPGVRRGPDLAASQRLALTPGDVRLYGAEPLGDVDGDGRTEIAGFLGLAGWGVLHALPQPGELLPATSTGFQDGTAGVRPVGAGDVDGDGVDDIALARSGRGAIVFFGRSGIDGERYDVGELPAPTRELPVGLTVQGPAGDLDGDGTGDILVRRDADRALLVLPGGAAAAPWRAEDALAVPAPAPGQPEAAPVADIDGDGRDELVVTVYECDTSCHAVSALAGIAAPATLEALRVAPAVFGSGGYRPSFRQGARITTRLTAAARVDVTVTPWFGGTTRTFSLDRPAGTSSFAWDGRVDGARLRPGVYRIAAAAAGSNVRREQTVLVLW